MYTCIGVHASVQKVSMTVVMSWSEGKFAANIDGVARVVGRTEEGGGGGQVLWLLAVHFAEKTSIDTHTRLSRCFTASCTCGLDITLPFAPPTGNKEAHGWLVCSVYQVCQLLFRLLIVLSRGESPITRRHHFLDYARKLFLKLQLPRIIYVTWLMH